MAEFTTEAELSITIPDRELTAARRQIESELSDIEIGITPSVSGGGVGTQPRDPSTGRFMEKRGAEQRLVELQDLAEQRNVYLENIDDNLDTGGIPIGGGGEGGGGFLSVVGAGGGRAAASAAGSGAGSAAGSSLGTTALGIGAGVGLGALGIGAGIGAATGQFAQEEFVIDLNTLEVTPTLQGPFVEALSVEPEVNLAAVNVQPEVGDISVEPEIGTGQIDFSPTIGREAFQFNPQLGPERFDLQLGPEDFTLQPSIGDVTVRNDVAFSPSITISPQVSLTGVDLSGLSVELRQEIINSRQFQNELQNAADAAAGTLETRIERALGVSL